MSGKSDFKITNYAFKEPIHVKMDYASIYPQKKMIKVTGKAALLNVGYDKSMGYEVFEGENKIEFDVDYNNTEVTDFPNDGIIRAFMTINIKKDSNEEEYYCKYHPIMKRSSIRICRKENNDIYLSIRKRKKEKNVKQITVHNDSSKRVWVRISAATIEQNKKSKGISVDSISVSCGTDNCIKHDFENEIGYTRMDRNTTTYFFVDDSTGIFFLSVVPTEQFQTGEKYGNRGIRYEENEEPYEIIIQDCKEFENKVTAIAENSQKFSF